MNTTSKTKIHCQNCGTNHIGVECPICAPLDRIHQAVKLRRQFSRIGGCKIISYTEISQPPERETEDATSAHPTAL